MIPKRLSYRKVRNSVIAYLFILPAFIIFTMIVIVPTIDTFYLSMTNWDGVNPVRTFIGFNNYLKALFDKELHKAFVNNIVWIIFFVSVPLFIGLSLAIGITKKGIIGREVFRTVYFIPFILSPVVVALIWKWIYSPNVGILTWILQTFHITNRPYSILGDTKLALYGLIMLHIWQTFGFCTIIYMIGLQNIDQTLYDAAALDGANALQKFWYVTLPGLSNVTTFLILLNIINSFKVFNPVFLLTAGGPGRSTEVAAFYLYKHAFMLNRVGYGCTIAVFLTLVLIVFGIFFITRREKKTVSI